MIRPRSIPRWLAAVPAAIGRGKPRRALLAGATVATVVVGFGIGAHNWANAAPTSPAPKSAAPQHVKPAVGTIVPGSYIVTLKKGTAATANPAAVHNAAASLARTFGGTVTHTYTRALNGFSARMSAAQAKAMAARPEVAKVEPDRVAKATDTVPGAQWNLDRIDQPYLPLNGSYTFPVAATNVHAYVIDTGIHIQNVAFGGRASYGDNEIQPGLPADDCDTEAPGHGTHVAGTIGGTGFGVAPGVQLVAVKVLGWDVNTNTPACNGTGLDSQIIAGIDWVTANAVKPAVANMSIGGGQSDALDAAVQKSIDSGVTYTLAAGNDSIDACLESPSDVKAAITVGASDINDRKAFFSNTGPCVDLFAPGVNVVSALNADTGSHPLSGTSMAAPHVAGAAALVLAANPGFTPQQVRDTLVDRAVTGAVDSAGIGTPDKLLQVDAATPTVKPEVLRLRARNNGMDVTADASGNAFLIANRLANAAWEDFDEIDNGDGTLALRAHSNGKFVTADLNNGGKLINNRTAVGAWEKFQITTNGDGSMSLKAMNNGKFVSADNFGNAPLVANRAAVGLWEEFDRAVPTTLVSLGNLVDFVFPNFVIHVVTAENGGNLPLKANRDQIGTWEEFDAIDLGDGVHFALRSHANGKLVTADLNHGGVLIANRTSAGAWEKFQVLNNGPDPDRGLTNALQANANGRIVTADFNNGATLTANRTAVGPWEKFFVFNF